MSDVKVYVGTLIGPEGQHVGRWVRWEDYSNATGGQRGVPALQSGGQTQGYQNQFCQNGVQKTAQDEDQK